MAGPDSQGRQPRPLCWARSWQAAPGDQGRPPAPGGLASPALQQAWHRGTRPLLWRHSLAGSLQAGGTSAQRSHGIPHTMDGNLVPKAECLQLRANPAPQHTGTSPQGSGCARAPANSNHLPPAHYARPTSLESPTDRGLTTIQAPKGTHSTNSGRKPVPSVTSADL